MSGMDKSDNEKFYEDGFEVPEEVKQLADRYTQNLLPKKSRDKYENCYERLKQWMADKKVKVFSEPVLLAYFGEQSQKYKPSTLWAQYSMIKSTLNVNHDIQIGNFKKINAFLKQNQVGYQPKKAKILTAKEVEKFLNEAPDQAYLQTKVILMMGVMGALRRDELHRVEISHVRDLGDQIVVDIPETKTYRRRFFIIDGDFLPVIRKYIALRPEMESKKFFTRYQNGKIMNQVVGIHKFGQMPRKIAEYLNLPDSDDYTGHAFRRTSATLLSEGGADFNQIMQHGGWKSDRVARGYVESTLSSRAQISRQIRKSIFIQPVIPQKQPLLESDRENLVSTSGAHFSTATEMAIHEDSQSAIPQKTPRQKSDGGTSTNTIAANSSTSTESSFNKNTESAIPQKKARLEPDGKNLASSEIPIHEDIQPPEAQDQNSEVFHEIKSRNDAETHNSPPRVINASPNCTITINNYGVIHINTAKAA